MAKSRKFAAWTAGVLAMGIVGCGNQQFQQMGTTFTVKKQASIAGVDKQHARMIVTIVREGLSEDGRSVQKLPTSFDNVDLTLSNSNSLLTGNKTAADVSVGPSATQATKVFSALRPGSGYKLAAVLQNGSTTVGSGYADGITLTAGQTKVVTIVISVNGDITVKDPDSKNESGDSTEWFVVKGDTITFTTGFNQTESPTTPAKMEIYIEGDLYPGAGAVKIDEKTSNWHEYTFVTGTDIGTSPQTYEADDLNPSTGNKVTFRLKDSDGNTIGESVLSPLTVLDPAAITLQLQ